MEPVSYILRKKFVHFSKVSSLNKIKIKKIVTNQKRRCSTIKKKKHFFACHALLTCREVPITMRRSHSDKTSFTSGENCHFSQSKIDLSRGSWNKMTSGLITPSQLLLRHVDTLTASMSSYKYTQNNSTLIVFLFLISLSLRSTFTNKT